MIVYRDEHYLVLNKPAGLATTAPPNGDQSLVALAKRLDPEAPLLHPTSRLDKQVTGLVTFARTPSGNRRLLNARKQQHYRRAYCAMGLSTEPLEQREGRWQWPIGYDPQRPQLRKVHPEAAPASTLFCCVDCEVLDTSQGRLWLSVLLLFPETGRTHQLRIHAAQAAIPLFGDTPYGGSKRVTLANGLVIEASRSMLHCVALQLPHAGHEAKLIELVAPLPKDFQVVLTALYERERAAVLLEQLQSPVHIFTAMASRHV